VSGNGNLTVQLREIPLSAVWADGRFLYACAPSSVAVQAEARDLAQGKQVVLTTRLVESDRYQLVTDYLTHAALLLNLEAQTGSNRVLARVYPADTDELKLVRSAFQETDFLGWTQLDLSVAAHKLIRHDDLDRAQVLGLLRPIPSKQILRQVMALQRLPEPVQQAVHDGSLSRSAAIALRRAGSSRRILAILERIQQDLTNRGRSWTVAGIDRAVRTQRRRQKNGYRRRLVEKVGQADFECHAGICSVTFDVDSSVDAPADLAAQLEALAARLRHRSSGSGSDLTK